MVLARTFAVALTGMKGAVVEVEADISSGLPAFILIGLPDAALGEARQRVNAAALNAGCPLTSRKLTVNLSPAALRKQGSSFDLAIAIAALAADGVIDAASAADSIHVGELGLDGRLRPVPGVLPSVLAARDSGFRRVFVPAANEHEAALVDGIQVCAVASLRDAAIAHGSALEPLEVEPILAVGNEEHSESEPDISDIAGNGDAVEALVVAAAGGHHVVMVGPPGAGKTMLARRLPTLLPDLTAAESLETTSIRSLSGSRIVSELICRPPFEAPHHTSSAVALIGGGSGRIVPGAIVRATHGILFLDEAAEFPRHVLDSLRQPLETGVIDIHRATVTATYPARFQLVVASNPCPCGHYGSRDSECSCTSLTRRRYLGRLSGPLLDRIDLRLNIPRLGLADLRAANDTSTPTSAELRLRVCQARNRAQRRLAHTPWRRNADVPGSWFRTGPLALPGTTLSTLDRALERGSLTMRGYDRVLRTAWTLADLDESDRPNGDHIGCALYFRQGYGS